MDSKRQLPPWMLRAEATDKATNSVSVVKRKGKGSKQLPTETCHPNSTLEVEEVTTGQSKVTTKTDSSSAVKKSKTTRSRRKPVKRADDDDDGDISNEHLEKESYAPPRRKRKAKGLNPVEETNLSEDELSVDDLISIAKEYVNAEKKKEGQRSEFAECESLKNETTHNDHTTSGDSTSNVNTLAEASSSDLVECQPSEKDFMSSLTTSVLTQDILELFLGPFVKKCSQVKLNPEPVTSSSTESDHPSSKQTQDGLEGDAIPPVKKKGSLKDRVALM